MIRTGETRLPAPRPAVFEKLSDARFFATCVEGVSDIAEVGPNRFTGTLEIRVARIPIRFAMELRTALVQPPVRVDFRAEGSAGPPLGQVRVATTARLRDDGAGTLLSYDIEVDLPGRLIQPIVRAKAREIERQFIAGLTAAFAPSAA